MNRASQHNERPLVVDLDGTLVRTNLLFESTNRFIAGHPFQAFRLPIWLAAGKPALKEHLAAATDIDPGSLPYNHHILSWLQQERKNHRRLVLATASHRLLAEKVAEHLGLFDEVLATEGATNLKAENKREALIARYGEEGFDYVGNDHADLPVWAAAHKVYMVGASSALASKVNSLGKATEIIADDRPSAGFSLLTALRPHQWAKNLLLFIPLLAAHRYGDMASLLQVLLALFVFSLAASSVYLLNDLVDVADDRHHPRKRRRPFASGHLSLLWGWLAWPALLLSAFIVAGVFQSLPFVGCLAAYIVATLAYSLRLKQHAVIDVLTLAGLYTLRIIAGAVAIDVPISFWLLSFSMFIFLSLAFMKRFSELRTGSDSDDVKKLRGRGYHYSDLGMVINFGIVSGYMAVLVLALYIQDSHTTDLYSMPQIIWLACPLLLYWISRTWLIAHRGEMHDDPVVFALKDKKSWLVGGCFAAVFVLAKVAG